MNAFRHEKVIEDTSAALLSFVSSLVSDDKTLSQCIQQHVNKSTNQTSLGLAVKLHHQFGSSDLISIFNDYGIVSSYGEVLRFRKSAAKYVSENSEVYHRELGLERRIGPIFSWCDNYDLVVLTPNGRRATHAMTIEFTQNPAGIINPGSATPGVMHINIPRLRKSEAAKLSFTERSLQVEHYAGQRKLNPPELPEIIQSQPDNQRLSVSLAKARCKDAEYFY